ncbi:hypothetical protein AAH476_25995, partial [Enterobacter cloacae subsp. cloacae]
LGENIHIATLESNDVIKDFFENEPEEAQVSIYNTLSEEFNAITDTILDKTSELNAQAQQTENAAENIGKVIGAIVLIGFIVFILSQIN